MAKKKNSADSEIDVDAVVADGEDTEPVTDKSSSPNPLSSTVSTIDDLSTYLGGTKASTIKAVDDVVAERRKNGLLGQVLDSAADDITRAKATENMSAMDLARSEVISDIALDRALVNGEFVSSLAILHAKKKMQADHVKILSARKKLELDDLSLHRQQIILATVNDVSEELTTILKEVGLTEEQQEIIMVKFGERAGAMFGGS